MEESQPRSVDAKPRSDREDKRIIFKDENDVHYFNKYACAVARADLEMFSKQDAEPEVGVQQMVTTVDENRHAFTDQQFARAKQA